MIKSFKDRDTAAIFYRRLSHKLPQIIWKRAHYKLLILDGVTSVLELRSPPGNHLEQLKGNRKNQYSIRINDQWRVCFIWEENNAYEVEITDYH